MHELVHAFSLPNLTKNINTNAFSVLNEAITEKIARELSLECYKEK
jgi:hypothetical protein